MAEESGFDTEKYFQAEAKRRTTVVVQALEDNNPTNFATAVTSLFTLFGLTPSSDSSVIQENRERWERVLRLWKSGASFVDIEMLGEAVPDYLNPVNQYLNIYITRYRFPVGGHMIGISPGACSLPRDPSRKPLFSSREHDTGGFYEQFENNVGVDLDTFIDESAHRWRGERQQKASSFFLVVGKQNVSLPVNKWSIGLLEKLRGPTAIRRI